MLIEEHSKVNFAFEQVHVHVAFTMYYTYTVSSFFPSAVNDSCLVYDHRIVIDSDNSTNDTRILAAGSVTKFSRIYRTQ